MSWDEGLSDKQAKFVKEYLIDLNATQAAIRAGYSGKTAYSIGWENLKKPEIQEAITKYREFLQKDTDVTPEKIIAEYAKLAFADPQQFYAGDGSLIPIPELPKHVAAALQGFEVNEISDGERILGHTKKITWHNKKSALDSLARINGMFVEKKEITGKDGAPIQVEQKTDITGFSDVLLDLLEQEHLSNSNDDS